MRGKHTILFVVCLALFAGGLGNPDVARSHCDGLDGPVVKAAQMALETRAS